MNKSFNVKTPLHKFTVDYNYKFVNISDVKVEKLKFLDMCKKGCKNFENKYSCPPFSPDFEFLVKGCKKLFVVMLSFDLKQLVNSKYKDYHKLKIGNAVIKPRIERLMRNLEIKFNTKFLGSGACRLCKPCVAAFNKPCKHPEKLRFSLESVGVDCNDLFCKLFGKELLWYSDKKAPLYTSVVAALLINNKMEDCEIVNEFEALIRNLD